MRQKITASLLLWAAWACLAGPIQAAAPSPDQLLPSDTIGLISVPDWQKAAAYFEQSSLGQLWRDPALKPFKDKFLKQFTNDFALPVERELGIRFADYSSLVRGQVTLAFVRSGWDGISGRHPGIFLLIDAKDRSDQLKSRLSELTRKWVDAGKEMKTEKIRDVNFTTLRIKRGDLNRTFEKAFPPAERTGEAAEKAEGSKEESALEVSFGQSDSLLIIGNTLADVEKILIRQSGGSLPSLAEQADYTGSSSGMLRDALACAWINFKPIYEGLMRQARQSTESAPDPENPLQSRPDKILLALGLGALQSAALKASASSEGAMLEVRLSVPESGRQGIFKILAAESKDSAPPPFVPADVVKYNRWRLDGQKAWAALESIVTGIFPEMAGVIQMALATVGKDRDPNFDLKRDLIGNLGNDFMVFEKNPRTSSVADQNAPPSIYLIGSPNAEKLAHALKATTSLLPLQTGAGDLKEREFLGRRVYSVPLPAVPAADGSKPVSQSFSFAASGGYVALSTDTAMIEEFLRSSESNGKTLREAGGLTEAAQKVGGMSTGFFGYENHAETMRATIEALKNHSARLEKLLSMATIGDKSKSEPNRESTTDWLDFGLLPPYEKIAKYFHFMVYAGSSAQEGLNWKVFLPTPPQLKQ